jgi:hypothetical protein
MPDKPPSWPVPRDKTFNVRIDSALYEAAATKAAGIGVAAVVRALLRAFVRGAVELPAEDLDKELMWAPRMARKPRQPKRRRKRVK